MLKAGVGRGVDVPQELMRGGGRGEEEDCAWGLISNSPLCHLHRQQLEFLWRGFHGCAKNMSICMMAKAAFSAAPHLRAAGTHSPTHSPHVCVCACLLKPPTLVGGPMAIKYLCPSFSLLMIHKLYSNTRHSASACRSL